ncbi:MAG: glycosyltransferase [Patescibacteria group bacterium]|jgi:glycosyltransferase involved in cell wall biosynthesis
MDELLSPSVKSKVVAVNPSAVTHFRYQNIVIGEIRRDFVKDYQAAAEKLNKDPRVKLVSVQHEFGIYGGEWGEQILELVRHVKKPVVITFHSVLPKPILKVRRIVRILGQECDSIIVMTHRAKQILTETYRIAPERIAVIPHGVHPQPYRTCEKVKTELGLRNKTVLLTFGLLSENKGLEYVIRALPQVIRRYPNVRYLIVGATHPAVLKREGERYRNALVRLVYKLNLTHHVKFYNTFFSRPELLKFIEACDIYVSTSLDPDQAVSGTLSYALGMGRPIVTTPFSQAREIVSQQLGMLVEFRQPRSYAQAIISLIGDKIRRDDMSRMAYFRTRSMIFPNVAVSLSRLFARFIPNILDEFKHVPPIRLSHFHRLTDRIGMFQFAKMSEPDPEFGYTLDDNARALLAVARYYEQNNRPSSQKLLKTYLSFVKRMARPDGNFINYIKTDLQPDQQRNTTESMQDANARACYALSYVASSKALSASIRQSAKRMLGPNLKRDPKFTYLRSMAFYIIGLAWLIRSNGAKQLRTRLDEYGQQLLRRYRHERRPDWDWFEGKLTYSNAILPEALLWCYRVTNDKKYLTTGLRTLKFLISKTFRENMYLSIGQSGWHRRGGRRHYFDQQPEDVSAMVQVLRLAYDITGEDRYRRLMFTAFYWFLGDNLLGQVVYDRTTGGSYDGVGQKSVNLNQGAESTVSYLLARLALANGHR